MKFAISNLIIFILGLILQAYLKPYLKNIEKISSKIHRPWLRKNKSIISTYVLSYLWSIFAILLYAIYLLALVNHQQTIALLSGMWSMSIFIDKWFLLKNRERKLKGSAM